MLKMRYRGKSIGLRKLIRVMEMNGLVSIMMLDILTSYFAAEFKFNNH